MEFLAKLDSQLAQFPEQTAQDLLSGILFEIYFDSNGEFRRLLKFAYVDNPLVLVAIRKYLEESEFIRGACIRGGAKITQ
jgi:hypothetical protein